MNNILDTMNNPSMLHAAMVHFPVVLATLGFFLVLLLSYFNDKMNYRWLAIMIYLMCTVSGWLSKKTGEGAEAMVSNRLASDIWDRIGDHAQMGERVYVMAAVTLLFLIISLIEHDALRKIMTLFSLAASLATFALVAFTAHYGGVLVYELGVGTPMSHVGYESVQQGTPTAVTAPSDAMPIREINMEEARLVSYTRDIWPIFEDRCLTCHETPDPDGEYAMDDYAAIMTAGPKGGASVVAGKPDESSIVLYIRGIMKPQMPKKKEPLSEEQLHLIRMWIAAGAVDDSATVETAAPMETTTPTPVAPASTPAFDPFGGDAPKTETKEVVVEEEKKVETAAPSFDPFGGADATPKPAPETAPVTTPEPAPVETPAPESVTTPEPIPAPTPAPFNALGNSAGAEPQVEKKEETFDPFGGGNIQPKEPVELTPPPAPEKVEVPDKVEEKAPEPKKPAPIKPRRNPLFDPFSA